MVAAAGQITSASVSWKASGRLKPGWDRQNAKSFSSITHQTSAEMNGPLGCVESLMGWVA